MKHKKVLSTLLSATIAVMCNFTSATDIFAEQIGSTKDIATTTTTADGIAINDVNFPDDNFRSYVSSNCDKNSDSVLSSSEIESVTEMSISSKNITNLKGIEYFTALTYLDCSWNNMLTSLDVSKNTALETLACKYNQLTVPISTDKTFDLSSLPNGFDVTKASNWTNATVNGNILTVTDVSLGSVTYTYDDGNDNFDDPTFELKVLNVIVGDVNDNGTVDAVDASIVLSAYATQATSGKTGLSSNEEKVADVNSNGVVDAVDASIILSYYAYISTGGTASLNEFINM